MSKEKSKELYKRAALKWGVESQIDMVVEECAELIHAVQILKRKDDPQNVRNVCEEIADVEIMIEQAKLLFDHDGLVNQIKQRKLDRLKSRLDQ